MVFSSILFLCVFMPVVFCLYYICPGRLRNFFLLVASLLFYAWGEPKYICIMLFSTAFNYIDGILIEYSKKHDKEFMKKAMLVLSVIGNVAILCFFKYTDFIIKSLNDLWGTHFSLLGIALPIGISFYTFQAMSYMIDVYRGRVSAQHNFFDFAMYICMFPQLIAGPIVRYEQVEGQIKERKITSGNVALGLQRFIIGLGKKVLLANQIGSLWDKIYTMDVSEISVLSAWLGAFAYTFQIYFDFSGYSDMAIGMGQMLGFKFPENFNYPYMSKSITEFWKRWHITLGQWFKEYVYIPLGGNRKGMEVQIVNLFIVWSLTGLWHGAGWNFLIWGLYYFVILLMEKLFLHKLLDKLPGIFSHIYSIFIIVVGWVIFACDNFDKLGIYIKALFGMGVSVVKGTDIYLCYTNAILFIILIFASTNIPVKLISFVKKKLMLKLKGFMSAFCKNIGFWCCAVFYLIILALSIALIIGETYNPFLYFRF